MRDFFFEAPFTHAGLPQFRRFRKLSASDQLSDLRWPEVDAKWRVFPPNDALRAMHVPFPFCLNGHPHHKQNERPGSAAGDYELRRPITGDKSLLYNVKKNPMMITPFEMWLGHTVRYQVRCKPIFICKVVLNQRWSPRRIAEHFRAW